MEIITTEFPGLLFIKPKIFGDARGYFYESWNRERYENAGITEDFVQDNVSFSSKGVLRGLHYQKPYTQGKLVSVLLGEVWDVVVDLRRSSPHSASGRASRSQASAKNSSTSRAASRTASASSPRRRSSNTNAPTNTAQRASTA